MEASEVEEREKEDTWDTNTYFILVSFFFLQVFLLVVLSSVTPFLCLLRACRYGLHC